MRMTRFGNTFKITALCFLAVVIVYSWISGTGKPVAFAQRWSDESLGPDQDVLRVGVTADAAPMVYMQGKDIVGLEVELAHEFARSLGKRVRLVEVEWKNQIPALLDKKTDIIMSGMSITKMRQYRIAFSEPYFRTGQLALVRKSDKYRYPKGFYGIFGWAPQLKIGVVRATTGEFFVQKEFGSAKAIVSYPSSKEAIAALITKRIDLFVYDAPMAYVLAAENESGLAPLPTLLTEEYLAWGVRKNDTALLEAADSFVRKIKRDGRLVNMVQRWIPFVE